VRGDGEAFYITLQQDYATRLISSVGQVGAKGPKTGVQHHNIIIVIVRREGKQAKHHNQAQVKEVSTHNFHSDHL
jgi:hypothetical protein